MSCGKIKYNTQEEAKTAIGGINGDKRYRRSKRQPKGTYFCDACGAWHLYTPKRKTSIITKTQELNVSDSKPKSVTSHHNQILKIKNFTSGKI